MTDLFYTILGSMLSSGFLIIPVVIYFTPGPWIIISYIFTIILYIPGVLAKSEFSTAIPKSEENFIFIQRNLGSALGTFSGIISWFTLVLTSALSIKTIGTLSPIPYISLIIPILFLLIASSGLVSNRIIRVIIPVILVTLLALYFLTGNREIDDSNFKPLLNIKENTIVRMLPILFVSFGGITNLNRNKEDSSLNKAVPRVPLLSLFMVATIVSYMLFTFVGTGMKLNLSIQIPLYVGLLVTGYTSMSQGRKYPLLMSKDNLIPSLFSKVSFKFNIPILSTVFTFIIIVLFIITVDIELLITGIATLHLLLLSFTSLALLILRKEGANNYTPQFKQPLFPWVAISGLVLYLGLIIVMGLKSIIITLTLILFIVLWYLLYSKRRVNKDKKIISIAQTIFGTKNKSQDLSKELSEILKERDDIILDRFDKLIEESTVIDLNEKASIDDIFKTIAMVFSKSLGEGEEKIIHLLKERESISSTVIDDGLAIPHIVVPGQGKFDICILRSKVGIDYGGEDKVKIFFAIGGSSDERNFHLQALMAIAQIVQNRTFKEQWNRARNGEDLKKLIILSERVRKGIV